MPSSGQRHRSSAALRLKRSHRGSITVLGVLPNSGLGCSRSYEASERVSSIQHVSKLKLSVGRASDHLEELVGGIRAAF